MSGEHTSHGVGNAKEGIMAEITWKSILTKLVGGDHLTAEESEWFVDDLMQVTPIRPPWVPRSLCSSSWD